MILILIQNLWPGYTKAVTIITRGFITSECGQIYHAQIHNVPLYDSETLVNIKALIFSRTCLYTVGADKLTAQLKHVQIVCVH